MYVLLTNSNSCEAYVASLRRSADLVSNITLEDRHSTHQMGEDRARCVQESSESG